MSELQSTNISGPWSLLSFSISFSDGREAIYPFGTNGEGLIIYSKLLGKDDQGRAYGKMSAVLSHKNRPTLSSTLLENSARASTEEKANAFDSYLHYAGRYHFEGNEIVHTVEFALNPNTIGDQQRRKFNYCDTTGVLTLSYQIIAKSGVVRTYTLTWQRQT